MNQNLFTDFKTLFIDVGGGNWQFAMENWGLGLSFFLLYTLTKTAASNSFLVCFLVLWHKVKWFKAGLK